MKKNMAKKHVSPEERERRLREGKIVAMEPLLAGTSYWGLAEAEAANAISAEEDPKRKKEMDKRIQQLSVQLQGLSREKREQILLEEIRKWKNEAKG